MYCKAISHLMLSINVPEALVGLELAADAVPPVEGEVVRAGAPVEVHYPHSRSAKLRESINRFSTLRHFFSLMATP